MVFKRLVRILAMLALLFAPLSMMSGHAAMAMPAAAAASTSHHQLLSDQSAHCEEKSGETKVEGGGAPADDCLIDCAVACSAIASPGTAMADQSLTPAIARPLPLVRFMRGLQPESDDPPPRNA